MHYAVETGRCLKVIILTNGFLLDKHLYHLLDFQKKTNIPIVIKISVNYWLYGIDNQIIQKCKKFYELSRTNSKFHIVLNVRLRYGDDWIVKLIEDAGLEKISNIFYLQSYGRYENETEYSKPIIVQNIDDWFIYACDGTCFGKDLIATMYHEKRRISKLIL